METVKRSKTVLILNQKGGVGKTSIADEVCFGLERSGIKIAFFDMDKQGGAVHAGIAPDPQATVNVIDTPGHLNESMGNWVKEADIVIIPTTPGYFEVEPLIRTFTICNTYKKKPILILNGATRFNLSRNFKENLEQIPYEVTRLVTIPRSEDFPNAQLRKVSVCEYNPKGKAAKAVNELVSLIKTELGLEV